MDKRAIDIRDDSIEDVDETGGVGGNFGGRAGR